MIGFRNHIVLVLLVLWCAVGSNGLTWAQDASRLGGPILPTSPASANRRQAQRSSAAGLEAKQGAGETRAIDVIGRGRIYRDDVAGARDKAIEDALQGVVEQAVGLVVSLESVVQDFQLLSDQVYDQTDTFIHDYKVLTESRSGPYYRVVVQATVSMNAIQDKLQHIGILVNHKGVPTVMFFLSEQNIDEPLPRYWWGQTPLGTQLSVTEKALSDYMRGKGFIIVDRAAIDRDIKPGPEYVGSELSDVAAAELGKEFGADLVIVGKAVARYSGNVTDVNMKSIQATVSTRAIRTDSVMCIASSQGTMAAAHSDGTVGGTEALILSASEVARDLARQIVANWRRDARQPVLVELIVKGIKEYADFVRFRTHLRKHVRGVRNVYLRSIRAGEAKMDVDVMGNPRILADELMLQRFENLGVNIFEVSEKVVKLELIPAESND